MNIFKGGINIPTVIFPIILFIVISLFLIVYININKYTNSSQSNSDDKTNKSPIIYIHGDMSTPGCLEFRQSDETEWKHITFAQNGATSQTGKCDEERKK